MLRKNHITPQELVTTGMFACEITVNFSEPLLSLQREADAESTYLTDFLTFIQV